MRQAFFVVSSLNLGKYAHCMYSSTFTTGIWHNTSSVRLHVLGTRHHNGMSTSNRRHRSLQVFAAFPPVLSVFLGMCRKTWDFSRFTYCSHSPYPLISILTLWWLPMPKLSLDAIRNDAQSKIEIFECPYVSQQHLTTYNTRGKITDPQATRERFKVTDSERNRQPRWSIGWLRARAG